MQWGDYMEAIMNYLLFWGGGAADPLSPLPCSAAYAQTVCSDKKNISRLNNSFKSA